MGLAVCRREKTRATVRAAAEMLGRGVFAAVAGCAFRGSIVGGDLAGRASIAIFLVFGGLVVSGLTFLAHMIVEEFPRIAVLSR